jgi:hypothetical protein
LNDLGFVNGTDNCICILMYFYLGLMRGKNGMFLFILQYESATTALVAEDIPLASDSLNGAGLAETAVEDEGVDWGQVSLYSLSTVGVWLVDGMISWVVQRTGQHLLRRELEGQAGLWTRMAL